MKLAIFDLDNTLLNGDSDYTWGCFLVDKGLVDEQTYKQANADFYQQYQQGTLDIHEFFAFSLGPLKRYSMPELVTLRAEFMRTRIEPLILPKAEALIDEHRQSGHVLLIITATNHFITEPIAARLSVDNLLATTPEVVDGHFTGKISGVPCFQAGKITRLEQWLAAQNLQAERSWFYSDSQNDIPLLEQATYPITVDADERLAAHASAKGWQQISLR